MTKKAFYSFHYQPDSWRASQVRNIGTVEGNKPCSDNDWETVTKKGDKAIQDWIDDQLSGRSCAIVLIGSNTAGRKWIKYEIEKAWKDKKGVVGVYVHNLKDSAEKQSTKGTNPFSGLTVGDRKLGDIVKAYDPPFTTSTSVYDHIKTNLESWLDEAITIRGKY
jgi:hypothetical protein